MHCIKSLLAYARHLPKHRSVLLCPTVNVMNKFVKQIKLYSTSEDETENIVLELSKGDPELEQKLRILMLEVEVMRQDGRTAPMYLNKSQWEQLLELKSRNQRNHYLTFLWKNEKSKENRKAIMSILIIFFVTLICFLEINICETAQ